jgi:hypothetical protein
MSPKLSVALRITGPSVDPAAIETKLGFAGTGKWKKGESVQGTNVRRKEDGWEFRIPFRSGYAIDDVIGEIQQAVGKQSDDLRNLCEERGFRMEIVCVVEMYDETAGLALGTDVVAWLAELRASLAIDTYVSERSTSAP